MYPSTPHVYSSQRGQKRAADSPRTGIRYRHELPCGCWEPNSEVLNTKPPIQVCHNNFKRCGQFLFDIFAGCFVLFCFVDRSFYLAQAGLKHLFLILLTPRHATPQPALVTFYTGHSCLFLISHYYLEIFCQF